MAKGTGYIRALDGLRGLAILPVTAYHYIGWNLSLFEPGPGTLKLWHLVDRGALGVTLFFVLSGYLITGILLDAKGSPGWIRLFLARRALRIFPLYYLALAIIFLLAPLLAGRSASELYGPLADHQAWLWTYTSNVRIAAENSWAYSGTDGFDVNHFWSLAVEEHFYLVWPLLVWACSRRALTWTALLLSTAALLLRGLLLAAPLRAHAMAAHVLTPCCMDALLIGGLAAILLRDPRRRPAVLRAAPLLLLAPALALALPHGLVRDAALPTLQALAFAGCIVACAHAGPESRLARVVGAAPLVFIGRISYGLYVVHSPLHRLWAALFPPALLVHATGSVALGVILFWALGLSLSIAVAVASFHLFEKPMLALKGRLPGSAAELASAAR